jgi:hypothetical protein
VVTWRRPRPSGMIPQCLSRLVPWQRLKQPAGA